MRQVVNALAAFWSRLWLIQTAHFDRITLVGIGLIGSSVAHMVRQKGLAGHIAVTSRSQESFLIQHGVLESPTASLWISAKRVTGADLVMICSPVSTYGAIMETIAPSLKMGQSLQMLIS